LEQIAYLQGSVRINGSGIVEGCTKRRQPHDFGIRQGQVAEAGRFGFFGR